MVATLADRIGGVPRLLTRESDCARTKDIENHAMTRIIKKVQNVKLSVIISTRNRAHAIAACLASIEAAFANASLPDGEIVVVDNGSQDSTAQIIKAWAAANPHVPVQALSEPCPGKARALNRAVHASRGELLAFTDDDCRLYRDHSNDCCATPPVIPGLCCGAGASSWAIRPTCRRRSTPGGRPCGGVALSTRRAMRR